MVNVLHLKKGATDQDVVANFTSLPVPKEPFSVPYEQFVRYVSSISLKFLYGSLIANRDITAGALGAYGVLQEAVSSFKRISPDAPRVSLAYSFYPINASHDCRYSSQHPTS